MKNLFFFFTGLLTFCTISQTLTAQKSVLFSDSDNLAGWQWDGKTASYQVKSKVQRPAATLGPQVDLIVRPFDGENFGPISFTTYGTDSRGWSWDGEWASYLIVEDGKTTLYVTQFDGWRFGFDGQKTTRAKHIPMSDEDNFLSWSWDGKIANYHKVIDGKTYLCTATFDGEKFGTETKTDFSAVKNIRSYCFNGSFTSFGVFRNGKTELILLNQDPGPTMTPSLTNIQNFIYSNAIETEKGYHMKYNLKNKLFVDMQAPTGKIGGLSLQIVPQTAYLKNEEFAYVFFSMKGASIDMTHYVDQWNNRGYYLKDVVVSLEVPGWDEFRSNPENQNESGSYQVSQSFSVGADLSSGGPGVSAEQTWGSSFTSEVKDFRFIDPTVQSNIAKFHWKLSKVGDVSKGDNLTNYINYTDVGIKGDGTQFTYLRSLPPLAANNFPIDCESIFRKHIEKIDNMPDQVKVKVIIEATFEKVSLHPRNEGGGIAFLHSLLGPFNSRLYSGELYYLFNHDAKVTKNVIEAYLDLRPFKLVN